MTDHQKLIRKITEEYQIPKTGTDLKEVLTLCLPGMNALCADPPEDWLNYSYTFLQARFFPENFDVEKASERRKAVEFYLKVLNRLFERERKEIPFDARRDFCLMQPEEEAYCDIRDEYRRFEKSFHEGFVYAFLRLSRVCTPYNTLGHVAGVHHVAMHMARQLLKTEVSVDPGLMSAAAMVHDMGKFGCRPAEARRVPYLHYYYTYQFCRLYRIPVIGSIASNHSVWDLELDNLSCESLLLIYADFRVKSVFDADRNEHIHFWTLKDSFDVILSKLDNVDDAKKQRYMRVYAKLKDFEDYLVSLGCSTELDTEDGTPAISGAVAAAPAVPAATLTAPDAAPAASEATPAATAPGASAAETGSRYPVLMPEAEVTETFKHLSIRFNLSVMHDANDEERFRTLLEHIRSEKDWRHVRAFLTAAGEYSVYFPQELKKRLLWFLGDMMSHQEGDIRRQAAAIAGRMIADYEISFTKEIPAGYECPKLGDSMLHAWESFLDRIFSPGPYMQDRQIRWTGYALKTVIDTLLKAVPDQQKGSLIHAYAGRCRCLRYSDLIIFILIDCASQIPYGYCEEEDARILSSFAASLAREKTGEIRVAAMWFLLGWLRQGFRPEAGESYACITGMSRETIGLENYCLRYLDARINEFFGIPSVQGIGVYELSSLYLENQRAEIPWIYKYLNLEILHKLYEEQNDENERYQYASHLLHLLQFGGRIVNRLQAGEHLLDVMKHLKAPQRYEILLELARALEINEYAIAKYIPPYLGRLLFFLPCREQHDFLERLKMLITGRNTKSAVVALETAGVYLEEFAAAKGSSDGIKASDDPAYEELQKEALGLLCIGLSHYEVEISRESLYITGQRLFGSRNVPLDRKAEYYSFMARKILSLTGFEGGSLTRYFMAAALHYIYTFISDYEQAYHGQPLREEALPCAFFPGTFDPFSLGHAKIVQEIRRMGYRVYLAADEFSWSKRTQPFEVRRKIIEMSTAHMEDVYLFPEEIPVNIAFPQDIRRLIDAMNGRRPALVAGSDVVKNASAYRKAPEADSVQSLHHIIFARDCSEIDEKEIAGKLLNKPDFVHLPPHLESISSTMIRDNVNEGREISALVSTLAENYIRTYGLYAMEPAYKKATVCLPVETEIHPDVISIVREAGSMAGQGSSAAAGEAAIRSAAGESAAAGEDPEREICGNVWYHEINQGDLYEECQDVETASVLRRLVSGRIAVITRVEGEVTETDDKRLTAVNEALEWFQENSFSYVLCFCLHEYEDTLKTHGFVPVAGTRDVGIVDLRNPVVLFYDTASAVKEPLSGSRAVRLAIRSAHLSLLDAITAMFPGQLILCFESGVMNYRLAKLITRENPREAGDENAKYPPKMCVPFGKILKGNVVPDTVTKGLDTEKVFDEDLEHFTISEFPGYAPLDHQLRAIRSFYRPLILVDDLYHSGYRAEKILESCKKEEIRDVQLITGVLSGRGKDLSRSRNIPVRSVYSVPNMKTWFIESDLYPFLGGDSVGLSGSGSDGDTRRSSAPPLSLPSINTILPYEVPGFLKDVDLASVYHLSEVCLESARNIFRALEEEYSRTYGRRLVTERLREVIAEPRHPDSVNFDEEMLQELTSAVLDQQRKRLRRLKYPMNRK